VYADWYKVRPMDSTDVPVSRPPIWPSLLAPLLAFLCTVFASGTAVAVVALLSDPDLMKGNASEKITGWLEANAGSLPVILAVIVPGQVCFLGVAVLFALIERKRVLPYLGLVRWKVPNSTVALAVIGSLGVQFLLDILADWLIDEPSESLKMLARMFQEPTGLAAVCVGFVISVLPGLCEESLFRGVTQQGLLRRWSPIAAIGATSAFFAIAHWDVQHSLAVFPLGAWFGWVAWRTGSVWPAVMCHFVNNIVAFVIVRLWSDPDSFEMPKTPAMYVVGIGFVAVAIVAVVRLARTKPDQVLAVPMPR